MLGHWCRLVRPRGGGGGGNAGLLLKTGERTHPVTLYRGRVDRMGGRR